MPTLPYFPADASLLNVWFRYPAAAHPLLACQEALLRGPSALSAGERELIVAYISGLNGCAYCRAQHGAAAAALGIAPATIDAALADLPAADIDDKLKALLAFLTKLTRTPEAVGEDDGAPVLAAGWSEAALFDAVAVCGLAALLNRLVAGMGLADDGEYAHNAGSRHAREGYTRLIETLGI